MHVVINDLQSVLTNGFLLSIFAEFVSYLCLHLSHASLEKKKEKKNIAVLFTWHSLYSIPPAVFSFSYTLTTTVEEHMKSRAHLSKVAMLEITGPPGWQKRAALTKRKRSLLLGPSLDNDQVCTVYDLGMRTLNSDKLLPWIQTF